MTYQFQYTERNNKTAAEFETKSLLYMIGKHKDSGGLTIIFVDCFNDVTGSDETYSKLYDMQAKGVAKLSPGSIGKSLVTLFLNYIETFPFSDFAILTPSLNPAYLVDPLADEFKASNFATKTYKQIREGLKKESIKRKSSLTHLHEFDKMLDTFLKTVTFVVDKKPRHEYVKQISEFKNKDRKEPAFYDSVFTDIMAIQVNKKLTSIQGNVIHRIADALNYERHIFVFDISRLLANRFVGTNLFESQGIPIPFLPEIEGRSPADVSDIRLECKSGISTSFFDKNKQHIFWQFLEKVLNSISNEPLASARDIYNRSCNIQGFSHCGLYGTPGVYFISLIMEGLSQ